MLRPARVTRRTWLPLSHGRGCALLAYRHDPGLALPAGVIGLAGQRGFALMPWLMCDVTIRL